MSQRRGIVTDQLINVIQVIQLGKKTGRLMVERGEDIQHEDGVLYFTHGRIVDAQCGNLHKAAAIDWLRTWGRCRFIFEAEENKGTTAHQPTPSSFTYNTTSHPLQRPMSGIDYQNRVDPRYFGQFSAPRVPNGQADPNTSGNLRTPQNLDSPPTPPPSTPRRTKQDEVGIYILTQAGLSRIHLRLYLLIDGRRNIIELIRLMGRPAKEVQQYLNDLRRLGIIHY
jgi:hypothetical protein